MQPITVSTTDASVAATYSRPVRLDSWANAQCIIGVKVSGTAMFTVQISMDDPNDPFAPTAVGSMNWLDAPDANLVDESSPRIATLSGSPTFVRLKQVSGNGTATMTVSQFGNATF